MYFDKPQLYKLFLDNLYLLIDGLEEAIDLVLNNVVTNHDLFNVGAGQGVVLDGLADAVLAGRAADVAHAVPDNHRGCSLQNIFMVFF